MADDDGCSAHPERPVVQVRCTHSTSQQDDEPCCIRGFLWSSADAMHFVDPGRDYAQELPNYLSLRKFLARREGTAPHRLRLQRARDLPLLASPAGHKLAVPSPTMKSSNHHQRFKYKGETGDYGSERSSTLSTSSSAKMTLLVHVVAIVAVAIFSIVGTVAQSENTVLEAIQTIAFQAQDYQVAISEVNASTISTQGGKIPTDLDDVAIALNHYYNEYYSPNVVQFSDDAASEIVGVWTGLIEVLKFLLETIDDKHSLAAASSLIEPIAAAVRTLEVASGDFNFMILSMVPTQRDRAEALTNELAATFATTKQTYPY